ncbi:hypothetical protein COT75_04320 [Candidatus Beckwithbacteria bacterium CG10_big_fil_rev_8_21_14_0_10_34_10]|uniref:Membrane insertase YidC/Oxa/ALB C-terminal domain-containing protein n=1 Tax=Candidatus Beckwithbacteria bacterium CG10_big_fil_rev_8_21_14_0_10_34_10 TaxID=1974495 RepID=A0A2H0W897_9BACT|nr:MAG: hypothetical protein COT75_04320 [Candidatus Beckwithbacteria bacterium CG10_big_fil_rev_8_21_14_0_10_34_10]
MNLWHTLLYQPLVNLLILFYNLLGNNLGLAIIGLTILIRLVLTPLTLPSLKSAQRMRDLAPELEKLKKKYKKDKQALAKAQLELYKRHGLNPASGCLPQIIQIIILIALFQAFNQVLRADGEIIQKLNEVLYPILRLGKSTQINTRFLYLELTQPDLFKFTAINIFGFKLEAFPGLFLIGSAVAQFISSYLMMPSNKAAEIKAKKTKEKNDDMAAMMQKQMLFMMPLMTLLIGFKFPSGLVLYWLSFSLFMLGQQLYINFKKKNESSKK